MGSFSLSGGVEVIGFISPTDSLDTYAVIDPLYGVDGFRNVNFISDLDLIPEPRRRAGMVVGVSGGTAYYKLNSLPWNYNFTDWSVFNTGGGSVSGDYLPLSGGTVTGNTVFNLGLSANTISATTYQNLPIDIRVTGGTYSNGSVTFTNNTGGTFNVSGFITGFTDIYTTGITFSNNEITISDTANNTYSTYIDNFTELTVNGVLSATKYQGLPLDVYVTGGTYSNGTATFRNNSGGTFNISGFYTGQTDNNRYTTGFTYNNNTFRISDNSGSTYSATINTMTGLTVNGVLSATTIGTSSDCVDDIYVSNIHSCSPLNINPLDEGNVYFGSTSGVTIDLTNNRVGIGRTTPTTKLDVSGNTRLVGNLELGNPTSNNSGNTLTIGHNGSTTLSNDGTATVIFASQFKGIYPFTMGAEGNGYNFYIRQNNSGQGTFGFDFNTISGVSYVKNYTYRTSGANRYSEIFTGPWEMDLNNTSTTNSFVASNSFLNLSLTGITEGYRIQKNYTSGYPISNEPIVSFFNGSVFSSGSTVNRNVARINRLGYLGIGTSLSYSTPSTEQQAAITIDQTTFTGVSTTSPSVLVQIRTIGRDTTCQFLNSNPNNVIPFGLIVGSKITANGITRTVTQIVDPQTLRLNSSVDWDNEGLGYNFTFRNPYISLQDGSQKYFVVDPDGNTSLQGLTATTISVSTISATTYQNLPVTADTFVTAFTYSNNTFTINRNQGLTPLTSLINTVTGLTINGNLTVTGTTSSNTISATTYQNLPVTADTFVTAFTYSNNTFTINRNRGLTPLTSLINTVTGLTINGNLTVTGNTSLQGLTATTVSATTYQNLPTDVFVTGGTYSLGTATFTNNTGGTFNVTGFFTGNTMTGQTSVDFGFTGGGESDYAYTVVSNTNISQSSMVMYSVISSDNHQQTEDSLLDGLTFKTSDIVDGVSFTVNCYALNNTWGTYNVFYKIIN